MSQQPSGGQGQQPSNRFPKPAASDARAAIYGLLGAIIGGLATFGGAYWTGHQAQSQEQIASERSAYVTFAAAGYQIATDLSQLLSTSSGSKAAYTAVRNRIISEVGSFNSDAVLVELVAPLNIARDAEDIVNTLFSIPLPANPSSLPSKTVNSSIRKSLGQLSDFQTAAHAQLNP